MSGFANSVVGGAGTLVRKFIQSLSYVPGVSGWRISQNGAAEFNNLTSRGSVTVGGPIGSAKEIFLDSVNGELDIYDAAGNLVGKISGGGAQFSPDLTDATQYQVSIIPGGTIPRVLVRPPTTNSNAYSSGGMSAGVSGVTQNSSQGSAQLTSPLDTTQFSGAAAVQVFSQSHDGTVPSSITLNASSIVDANLKKIIPSACENTDESTLVTTVTTVLNGQITSNKSFTKLRSDTRLLVMIKLGCRTTVGTGYQIIYGININATDADVGKYNWNALSDHRCIGADTILPAFAAGSYTFHVFARLSAAGGNTVAIDANDTCSCTVLEVI